MTYRQSVFKRYHSDKHFLEFYQQDGGKHQLAEICNDNYDTVTLSMAVARFSSGGVVIGYVFPVLWMTSYLHIS